MARSAPGRRSKRRSGARRCVRTASTSSKYAPKSTTATPSVCRSPGTSPSKSHAMSRVKAGLNVSKGLTSEASAFERATVERSVAAQLSRAEARRAATKIPSRRGMWAAQESGRPPCKVTEHCVRSSVPDASTGSEAAFVIQATSAGRASRKTYLFKTGKNEVRTVATSAKKVAILRLCRRESFHHPFLSTIRERQAKLQDFLEKHFEAIWKVWDELLIGILSPFSA